MKILLGVVRKELNITQKKISLLSGISQSHISEIETVRKIPTIETICKLSKALGVHPEDLYKR